MWAWFSTDFGSFISCRAIELRITFAFHAFLEFIDIPSFIWMIKQLQVRGFIYYLNRNEKYHQAWGLYLSIGKKLQYENLLVIYDFIYSETEVKKIKSEPDESYSRWNLHHTYR